MTEAGLLDWVRGEMLPTVAAEFDSLPRAAPFAGAPIQEALAGNLAAALEEMELRPGEDFAETAKAQLVGVYPFLFLELKGEAWRQDKAYEFETQVALSRDLNSVREGAQPWVHAFAKPLEVEVPAT